MTTYGYCRVVAGSQELEQQKQALLENMCDEVWIDEIVNTGKKERPTRDELIAHLKSGDTLVTDIIQLSRTIEGSLVIAQQLLEKGIKVRTIKGEFLELHKINLMLAMIPMMLKMQSKLISERMKEGKAIAKQREGYTEGRPKTYSPEQLEHAMKLLETKTYNEVAAETKISRSTLIREKSKRKNLPH